MTTLTPLSAERCALIDEYVRQVKTGELAEGYWVWSYQNCFGWQIAESLSINDFSTTNWRYFH